MPALVHAGFGAQGRPGFLLSERSAVPENRLHAATGVLLAPRHHQYEMQLVARVGEGFPIQGASHAFVWGLPEPASKW